MVPDSEPPQSLQQVEVLCLCPHHFVKQSPVKKEGFRCPDPQPLLLIPEKNYIILFTYRVTESLTAMCSSALSVVKTSPMSSFKPSSPVSSFKPSSGSNTEL